METSKLFKINIRDLIKGLTIVIIVAVLTALLEMIRNKGLALSLEDCQQILQIAIISGIGYLLKNFITDNNDKLLGKF